MPGVISVRLPDGSVKELAEGTTAGGLAKDIGSRLAKAAVVATVDGREVDLETRAARRRRGRRSSPRTATPGARCCGTRPPTCWRRRCGGCGRGPSTPSGPVIENGFYYDFELPGGAHFSEEDLERIDAEMRAIIKEDQPFERHEHTLEEGLEIFADQPFKEEIIRAVGLGGRRGRRRRRRGRVDVPEQRCVHRPVPGAARAVDRPAWATSSSCGSPGRTGGATSTASSCSGSTGRRGSRRRRWRRTCTSWRRRSGGTIAAWAPSSTCSRFPEEIGSGLAVFHPKGGLIRRADGGLLAGAPRRGGYDFVNSPHITKGGAVRGVGAPGLVRRGDVPADVAGRGDRLLPQADELPVPYLGVPVAAAVVPGAADAAVRVRHGLSLRAVRRVDGPDPGARHDPGRRPHLLHG